MTGQPMPANSVARPTGALSRRSGWVAQAARFLLVGVLNTLVDAALYFSLTRWLGFAARQGLAKGLSYGAGVLNSYYWNKTWTFRMDQGDNWRIFARFILTNLISLAINSAVMVACLHLLALPEALAWLAATGAAFAWNFLASKFFVFTQCKH